MESTDGNNAAPSDPVATMPDLSDIERWDREAGTFEEAPDHGLPARDVRQAWSDLLLPLIGSSRRVADLGCGTGSLSVLPAEAGHDVTGVDFSPR